MHDNETTLEIPQIETPPVDDSTTVVTIEKDPAPKSYSYLTIHDPAEDSICDSCQ